MLSGDAKSFEIEYPCHSSAEQRWFLLIVTPLVGAASNGVVVMHVNVMERKQATDSLAMLSRRTEQRERMLNSALASITDLTCIYDREGRFLFANQPLLDLRGVALEQAIGKNLSDLGYSPEFTQALRFKMTPLPQRGDKMPSAAGPAFAVRSRFVIANGMTQEVRAAFRQRPHLVDAAPGFVRMEVLSPADRPEEIWLMTYWTDAESYRVWHGSHHYRDSHAGIPKGLKLLGRETEIRSLEVICQ